MTHDRFVRIFGSILVIVPPQKRNRNRAAPLLAFVRFAREETESQRAASWRFLWWCRQRHGDIQIFDRSLRVTLIAAAVLVNVDQRRYRDAGPIFAQAISSTVNDAAHFHRIRHKLVNSLTITFHVLAVTRYSPR